MLSLFFSIIIFLFGLIVGSLLNCIIFRLKIGESFLKGRSYCPFCKTILKWPDLVPVLSFLILKGKCRYCQKPISWQYPLVEISTAWLFLLIFNFQFPSLVSFQFLSGPAIFNTLLLWLIACFLIIIFVYDLKYFLIPPDKVIYSAVIIVFIYRLFNNWSDWWFFSNSLLAAIIPSAFFFFLVQVSRGSWMGVGDIKLAFLMGLFLGWPQILIALFLAFFIGAVIGTALIILKKKTLKSEVPFAPFLVVATFISLFWGSELLNWYQDLFLLK